MSIINIALTGTQAAQTALNTTSQNIANVMTPGYTRQAALLTTVVAKQQGALTAGDGVQVPSLLRFSDGYKTLQMWQSNSELASRSTPQPYLTQLEQVMGDDGSSLNSGLDSFFAALNPASVEPSSSPLRQQVIAAAGAVAQRFNNLAQVLSNQRTSITQQRDAVVSQVNGLTAGIAELNQKIAMTRATGVNPSGLIDAREQKIDALAGLVALQVVDQPDGSMSVSLRGGQPLVVGATPSTLSMTGNPDGSHTLSVAFATESFVLPAGNLGGQLGGLDDYESQVLTPLRQSVSDMAGALASNVNAVLGAGFAPDGSAGVPLFEFNPTSATGLLAVSAGVTAQQLGFSADASKPGNSDQLLALIALKDQPITVSSLGTVLLGDANTQLVGKLGMDSQQNQASLATAQTVRNQAEENWKSTSGVNTDEEAVNLVQYQQMYQANMKVIAVANALFDNALAMMG